MRIRALGGREGIWGTPLWVVLVCCGPDDSGLRGLGPRVGNKGCLVDGRAMREARDRPFLPQMDTDTHRFRLIGNGIGDF